jgi:hypothetical protein
MPLAHRLHLFFEGGFAERLPMKLADDAFSLGLTLAALAGCAAPAAAQPCGPWSNVPTPNPSATTNLLIDVAMVSNELAIAVGNWAGVSRQPLVVRWDGASWAEHLLPDTSGLGTIPSVEGVGRTPNGDLWVVGYVRTPYPTDQLPLVMRWRGGAWETVLTPTLRPQNTHPFGARGGLAYDVAGVAANDVWVVGSAAGYGDASATSVPMALHFDGENWTDVPVPLVGNRHHSLDKVSASSSSNVWAVGTSRSIALAFKAFIVRWDGESWTHIPNPGEGLNGGSAEAVLALAPDDVWVSGSFDNGTVNLIHWNGSAWETPSTGIPGIIASFAATGPNDIWGACASNATIYHYDGTAWTSTQSPPLPGSTYVLRGWGMDMLNGCTAWAVGGYSNGTTQFTLAERLTAAACRADFNADGAVGSQDFFDFLSAFLAFAPGADFNSDGAVNSQDFFDFLTAFFAGC